MEEEGMGVGKIQLEGRPFNDKLSYHDLTMRYSNNPRANGPK
jgi:hypothetical protein